MTDTEVIKTVQMENLDETNYIGNISSSNKEFDAENLDAIKKYIEEQEQEILLRQSTSADDLESKTENQNSVDGTKEKECQLVHTECCDKTPKNFDKQTLAMVLSPNKIKSAIKDLDESVSNEGTEKPQSQAPSINNSVTELENEENFVNPAGKTLQPQEYNLTSLQASVKEVHQSDDKFKENIQEKTKPVADVVLELDKQDSPMSQEVISNGSENIEAPKLLHQLLTSNNTFEHEVKSTEFKCENKYENKEHSDETLAIATSVMDMILTDTEAIISKKKVSGVLSKQCLSPEKVNSNVSLAIGSKVEAKDFSEMWYPAQIIEVDCEEMEVLVEYDNQPKKHNEWINISSPRLRPISSCVSQPELPTAPPPVHLLESNNDPKGEDKQKVTFAVGERCLARWRDNRRFIATIHNDLDHGNYEVMFDDGVVWKCPLSRLYKLKESNNVDVSSGVDLCPAPAQCAAPPEPQPAAAPRVPAALARVPIYHTHLFDPARDYLGSKSERREKKRKLNIKEIFNIGQKRKKLTVDKEPKSTPICTKPTEEVKSEIIPTSTTLETDSIPINPSVKTDSVLELKEPVKKKPVVRKKPFMKKKVKLKIDSKPEVQLKKELKKQIPDAVAAIIGTVCQPEPVIDGVELEPGAAETKDSNANDIKPEELNPDELTKSLNTSKTLDNQNLDCVIKEEIKVEKFGIDDGVKHEDVIGKIKEVINKLEDGINKVEQNDVKPVEIKETKVPDDVQSALKSMIVKEKRKKSSKVKKGKKLRLMQEKKVKKQVEKVKCQLEEMKKQVEAMRKQILLKTEELASSRRGTGVEAGEGSLLPGEWCCRWVDGQPAGAVSEVEHDVRADPLHKQPLPRRSVQVEDNRLPPGWTKHMVRRSLGYSAGKWDVVLVSPENRRFHTKNDMRIYLENNPDEALKPFEAALMDFGIHLKLSKRLGWVVSSAAGAPASPRPTPALSTCSPLVKRKKLTLNKDTDKVNRKRRRELKIKLPRLDTSSTVANIAQKAIENDVCSKPLIEKEATLDGASIKDGFVHVGSLRVQVIETLLRCPAEGCFKNFRNTTLLKMHIKHYHRELRKMMGATPKVLDLAYARTRPTEAEMKRLKCEAQQRIIKVKLPRLHRRLEEPKPEPKQVKIEPRPTTPPSTPPIPIPEEVPKPQDSPKLRNALVNKPVKRPKVLLPVRNPEPEVVDDFNDLKSLSDSPPIKIENSDSDEKIVVPKQEIPDCGELDFETAISTHTVTRVVNVGRVKGERRRRRFASIARDGGSSECGGSEPDSRSSRSGHSPEPLPPLLALSSESNDDHKNNMYMFTENGERIKLVHMKREEIINCHCGFREEDGLMVQCELCLCWQHALCHNIQREAEVPEKYTCSICLNPRRGRRRQRFLHDQDRLYEGLLPAGAGARASEPLRRAHELAGNLLRAADALHAVRVNTHVATKKNHPKLYLWAKDWETVELTFAQEKLNSEYSDLNVIISNLGKENLPMKAEDLKEMGMDMKIPPPEAKAEKKDSVQKDNQTTSQALLNGILSSPGGVSLDLQISESELEKLAKSVQAPAAPQPEAAIENGACRARLLRHVQRCHALLDQRLDSIEAQVAELESQDPSLEDDETADFYPRTKQTMQMITRDLDTMEELGIAT